MRGRFWNRIEVWGNVVPLDGRRTTKPVRRKNELRGKGEALLDVLTDASFVRAEQDDLILALAVELRRVEARLPFVVFRQLPALLEDHALDRATELLRIVFAGVGVLQREQFHERERAIVAIHSPFVELVGGMRSLTCPVFFAMSASFISFVGWFP